jgi:hypothetical protein
MRRGNVVWPHFLAAGLVAGLAACGGSGGDPNVVRSTPAPTPTPCTQTTVEQDAEGIDPRFLLYFDFSVPDSGRLDTTLDWTFAASPMGYYLVPANTCNTLAEFNNRSCNFIIRSEPSTTKPKKISTPNFTAGNYRWIVGNFADVKESFSLKIVLSKGDCPALTGVPPGVSGEAADSLPQLERMGTRY